MDLALAGADEQHETTEIGVVSTTRLGAKRAVTRSPRARPRPFPLEDLIIRECGRAVLDAAGNFDRTRVPDGFYRCLGVDRQWWHRHLASGLTFEEADRFATMLGRHMSEIWDNWLDWEYPAAEVALVAEPVQLDLAVA